MALIDSGDLIDPAALQAFAEEGKRLIALISEDKIFNPIIKNLKEIVDMLSKGQLI